MKSSEDLRREHGRLDTDVGRRRGVLDRDFVGEIRRRRDAYLRSAPEARAEAGLAYAEAQVEGLRRLANQKVHRQHVPAGQEQHARKHFLILLRSAEECQASIRSMPPVPYGGTREQAEKAWALNARRSRLLRIVNAIVYSATVSCEWVDQLQSRRIAAEWSAISERLSGDVADVEIGCHRVHRPQGPRTRRRVAFRRTTRGSPARPDDPPNLDRRGVA